MATAIGSFPGICIATIIVLVVASTCEADRNTNKWQVTQAPPLFHNPPAGRGFARYPDEIAILQHNNDDDNDPDAPRMRVVPRTSIQQPWRPPMSASTLPLQRTEKIQPVRIVAQLPTSPKSNESAPRDEPPATDLWAGSDKRNVDAEGKGMAISKEEIVRSTIDEEEIKLKSQTKNLVRWLRNRLRKRLGQIANLEGEMETESILLVNLNDFIALKSTERHKEIRMKLDNQKRLSSFRQTVETPNEHIQEVETEKAKLSEQLTRMTRTYETLAQVHKDLRNKLRSAGLSHWLEARGREYMPETAVGVLSKSVEILDPVTQGIEKAYELDNQIVGEVENVVPAIARQSIMSKVLADVAMIMPLIPLFVLWYRVLHVLDSLSIVHIVFYITTGLFGELLFVIVISVFLGEEALHACQKSNESVFSGGVLFNFVLLLGTLFAQVLICVLQTCRGEVVQLFSFFFVMHHFWRHVFVPAMVGQPVTTSFAAHMVYLMAFGFFSHQKREALDWRTKYDDQIATAWFIAVQWTRETIRAMSNVFREGDQDNKVKVDDLGSFLSSSVPSSDSDDLSSVEVPQESCFDERVVRVDGDARVAVVDAPMQMRYARWTGATAWPMRQTAAARLQPWREEQAHDVVGISRSRRFTRFNTQVVNSNTYRSCLP